MHVGLEATNLLLSDLVRAGLLVETTAIPVTYLPAHALETMTLKKIVAAIRQTGETDTMRPEVLPDVAGVDGILADMDTALDTALGERTLRDISVS